MKPQIYKKRKAYQIPVVDNRVVVPNEILPEETDRIFSVLGVETQGIVTPDGVYVANSDQDEEEVVIMWDKREEEEDEVTPIVEAIRNIPQTVVPETDLTPVTEAIKCVEDAIYATEKDEQDMAPLIDALMAVRKAVEDKEYPEPMDITDDLRAIAGKIPQAQDLGDIVTLLRAIADKETPTVETPPFKFNKDGRLEVEVDRIGMGGGISTEKIEQALRTGTAVKTADSFSIDPFGRWRVSETETLFDSKQLFDAQPLFYDDQEISGSGTASSHSTALAQTTMSVTASTAGRRVRQTFMRFNYQPGKGQLILCTGVLNLSGGGTGIRQAFGYYDDQNGIFLQNKDGIAQIVKRSYATGSAVDTAVNQADWNIDKFDGTGPSGYTLDFTKSQIFWIDFEWLGVGRVRTGFVINGVIYYAHQFVHANNTNVVYMSTPNLPVRYEIENDGTGGAATLGHICTSIMSEGGLQENGAIFTADNGTTHVDANTADETYALVGIKLKSTHLGATVKLLNFSAMAETATAFRWAIYFNPTVAGTFTYADVTNSACQRAVGATANTVTGGTLITSGYVPGTSQQRGAATGELANALRLGSTIAGVSDTIVLCCTPLSANADIFGGLTWRELL